MRKYRVNITKPGAPPVAPAKTTGRTRRYVARASDTGNRVGGWEWGGCLQSLLWLLLALLLIFLLSQLFRGCSWRMPAGRGGGVSWTVPDGAPGNGPDGYRGGQGGTAPDNDLRSPAPTRPDYPDDGWRSTPNPTPGTTDPWTPNPQNPDYPYPDDGDGNFSIPGEEGWPLPAPENNLIAPPPTNGGVKDPERMKYISPDRLNVIVRSEGTDIVLQWARKFKSLYPDQEHYVNYYNEETHMLQITVPKSERDEIKRGLNAQMPEFDFLIFDNDVIRRDQTPTFPSFRRLFLRLTNKNWYLGAIQAVDAWEMERGDSTITVAVVDNFFDLSHPMLKDKVVKPYCVSRNSHDPQAFAVRFRERGDAHGTHVAATAVGSLAEDSAVSGIAPGCKLMPVMIGTEGNDYMDIMSALDGILYAIYSGADVINVSAGVAFTNQVKRIPENQQREFIRKYGKAEESVWDYVYDTAKKHNTVIVWAAGNDDILSGLDPSKRNNETIRVSAVNSRLRKSNFSNYGVFGPDEYYSTVSAPGEDIYNAVPNNRFSFLSGTSMAAPIVTGAVALMKSIDRTLTTEEIIAILQQTGKPVGDDIGPLIQIKDALTAVREGFLNYDDVIKNPDSVVGLWKSTTPLYNRYSRAPLIVYMQFFSSREGRLIVHENDTGNDFTAPLTLSVTSSGIDIRQLSEAVNPVLREHYIRYFYMCSPDANRSVTCHASPREDGFYDNVIFNLRKIQ